MPHHLFRHSSVIFLSVAVANVLAYLFHILIARSLGPAGYGEFGSLMAIFTILSVPVNTIQTVTTRFAAENRSREEHGKIGSLMFSGIRKLSLYGTAVFLLISVTSPLIADFLRVDSPLPVVIAGLAVLFSVTLPVNRGILQGIQKFGSLAWNNILESLIRLGIGALLIAVGWGVAGALLSFGIGSLAAFGIALIPLRFYWAQRDPAINVRDIYRLTMPVLAAHSFLAILVNGPTLFIKHFYSAGFTGQWNASLSLAWIILFFGVSISMVMFAKMSHAADRTEKKRLFKKSLASLAGFSLAFSVLFFFFSETILTLLFGPLYSEGAILLKWMGFAVSALAILQLRISYQLGMIPSGENL